MISLKNFYDNYRIKLLVSIVAINLFMVPVLIWNRLWLTHKFIYEREYRTIASLSSFLRSSMENDIGDRDTAHIQETMVLALNQTSIVSIIIVDTTGVVHFAANDKLIGTRVSLEKSGTLEKHEGLFYAKILPISPGNRQIGYMRVVFSLARMQRNLRETFYWAFGLNGAWVLLVLIAAIITSGRLFKPLMEMKDVSQRIARGDFSARTSVYSRDAVGELAVALNDMASQLHELTSMMQEKIEYATAGLRISNMALKQKTEELEESNRKLMELDALKTEFVSMVSHDLKTPLTSIIGFAKTMQSINLPPEQHRKYIGIIESEGKRLARLISEYLDISKIEAGKFTLNLGPVYLPALLDEIVQTVEVQHPGRLHISIGENVGTITADKDRLRRAILNLIDNAFKYSPAEEAVQVTLGAERTFITVSVEDRGIGVPPEERDKIFEKFYRGRRLRPNKYIGSGLGLTIVRAVVVAHGGMVWMEDVSPKGSRFILQIPCSGEGPRQTT